MCEVQIGVSPESLSELFDGKVIQASFHSNAANIYLFKVSNNNIKKGVKYVQS